MTRRPSPRPATAGLRAALERAAPKTPLAAAQLAWEETVGERIAAVAQPVAERDGTLVVECSDPIWTQELDLMQDDLLARLQARIGDRAPRALRFRAKEG
jgi:predicted nucleic acid-binding Zn ribbon protein